MFNHCFQIDALSIAMITLIMFVFISIAAFSKNYLDGDRKKTGLYLYLSGLFFSLFCLVTANHLAIFFTFWCASNFFVILMMKYRSQWSAAQESAKLATINYVIGAVAIAVSFILIYQTTGTLYIHEIIKINVHPGALILLIAATLSQSALWPFHQWLLSSLNSSTPVSAILQAALVNSGGFLLVRFAPLFLQATWTLTIIFILGITTALLAGFWQLVQTDIKRLLTCSTIAHMGFVLVQCGLGLFSAAVAHIFWHALFKTYLFLAAAGAAQRKRIQYPAPHFIEFFLTLGCGILTGYSFTSVIGVPFFSMHTDLFITILLIMGGAQLSLPLVTKQKTLKVIAFIAAPCVGAWYALSIITIQRYFPLYQPVPITIIHAVAFFILIAAWLFILFERHKKQSGWFLRLYMYMIHASQPHKKTITADRNQYRW